MPHQVTVSIGGRDLILETGRMAKQANGAVFAKYEGSAVLATVCCGSSPMESLDFVPLQVEYNEKYYAAGKIPGGFLKREGRPKDKEILVSRLIDRPMRPLFSKEFKRELQIIPTTVSADQINPPDIVAMNAASAAVCVSDIPFAGPVGAVRIANVDDELIINPSFDQISRCTLEIVVSGTKDGITMVEGGAKEVPEELLLSAIALAEPAIKKLCEAQEQLMALAGKEKLPLVVEEKKLERRQEMWDFAYPKMEEACFVKGKMNRGAAVKAVKTETAEAFADDLNEDNERLLML